LLSVVKGCARELRDDGSLCISISEQVNAAFEGGDVMPAIEGRILQPEEGMVPIIENRFCF